MKSYHALSETDLGVHYLQAIGGAERIADNAQSLVADVEAWLRRSKLDHRLADSVDIACEVFEIAKQVRAQSVPTGIEAQAAFQANIQSGTTADDAALRQMDELALSQKVSAMDMTTFAAEREKLGVTQSLGAFLGGRTE